MPYNLVAGWCWDNPLSAGSRLFAIRGRSETDILAVGADGVALYWNGGCWARARTGKPDQDLLGIWPAAGKTWQVVGVNGTLLTYDGSVSTEGRLGTETLQDISGGPGGSAFAVGNRGSIQFFDGGEWSAQDSGTSSNLTAVWAVSANEAWAFAEDGGIFHGQGGVWLQEATIPVKSVAYKSAVGLSDGGILAVGMGSLVRQDGPVWKQSDFATPTTQRNGVWHDSGLTWIVGEGGSIYLEDGGTEPSGTSQVLHSVWSRGEKAWAVGEGGVIVQRTGSQWAEAPGGVARTVQGLWSTADGLWAVGENSLIMRRVENVWRPVLPPEQNVFKDIWGNGGLLLVLGDGGKVYTYRDGTWKTELPGKNLNAFWGVGSEVWGVGPGGTVLRRDANGNWGAEPISGGSTAGLSLNAVWGSSATNLWAVGNNGSVATWDGNNWTMRIVATGRGLMTVLVTENSVWAGGRDGTIFRKQ